MVSRNVKSLTKESWLAMNFRSGVVIARTSQSLFRWPNERPQAKVHSRRGSNHQHVTKCLTTVSRKRHQWVGTPGTSLLDVSTMQPCVALLTPWRQTV